MTEAAVPARACAPAFTPRFVARVVVVALPAVLAAATLTQMFVFDARPSIILFHAPTLALLLSFFVRPPACPHPRRRQWGGELLFGLASVAAYGAVVVVLIFGMIDVFALFFNMAFGLGGTPWPIYYKPLGWALALMLALVLPLMRLRPWIGAMSGGWAMLAAGLILLNPVSRDATSLGALRSFASGETLMADYAPVAATPPAKAPSLVFLFLEGFDRLYADEALFGDLAAPIRRLEARALSFTNVAQAEATGWSAAGHTAAWCGLPLLPRFGRFDSSTEILPEEACLPNVLADAGYAQIYLSGAHVTSEHYYGFDNFLRRRDLDAILDSTVLEPRITDAPRSLGERYWGLYDGEVMQLAHEEIDRLAAGDRPFAAYLATMDTHGPMAGVSPDCTGNGEGRLDPDMALAVDCVARMTESFVDRILAAHDDVVVIVASDHLAHHNALVERMPQDARRNLVMAFGAGIAPGRVERAGTMLDLFPTVLDLMGFLSDDATQGGIGRSLVGAAPTLAERDGLDRLNARLRGDAQLTEMIWGAESGGGWH